MRLPRVYICAPYTDENIPQEKANKKDAENDAVMILREGLVPRCPHSALGPFTPTQVDGHPSIDVGREEIMRECYDMLKECDAIYLHPGWEDSKGCRKEFRLAYNLGITILDGQEALESYAEKFRPRGGDDA